MKIRSLKTVYGILVSLLLLAGTVHATTLTPASGTTLAGATINRAYTSATFTAAGCTGGTYNWTATGLPAGLHLNSTTGTTDYITGTPTASGSFTITVTVTHTGCTPNAVNTYYLTVNPALALTPANNTAVSPNAITNVAYTSTTIFTASGGTQPYTWSTPTNLPAGLSLSSTTGNNIYITGTPTAGAGTYTFRVRVTEYNGSRVTNTYTITISNTGCDFVNGVSTGSISFGNIDPSIGGTIYGTVTTGVQFTCSSALAYTITVSPASGWQLTSGSNTMAYTLGVASSGTYGTTAVNIFPSSSTNMIQGQYANAPAGSYSNTTAITVTISWTGGSIVASLPVGSVTGTMASICTINAAGAMSFTISDPSAAGPIAATGSQDASIYCTNNTSYTVTAVSGNAGGSAAACSTGITGTLIDSSRDTMSYTFTCGANSTGSGFGSGNFKSLGIGGSIASAAYINAPVSSSYADTITITISY